MRRTGRLPVLVVDGEQPDDVAQQVGVAATGPCHRLVALGLGQAQRLFEDFADAIQLFGGHWAGVDGLSLAQRRIDGDRTAGGR